MLTGLVPGRGTDEVGAAQAKSGAATALSIRFWENGLVPLIPVVPVAEALWADSEPEPSTAVTV